MGLFGLDACADVWTAFYPGLYVMALLLLVGYLLVQSLIVNHMLASRDLEIRPGISTLLAILITLPGTGWTIHPGADTRLAMDLEELTGGHTRIVWVQDREHLNDVFAYGADLYLMGYDSRDGRGQRTILPQRGSYAKPMLSPDGSHVIYSDRPSGSVYALDWDGLKAKRLADGFALTVWRDPETQIDWVYVGRDRIPEGSPAYQRLYRVQLSAPDQVEFVMQGLPVGENNFQLSADGRIGGGNFPWPECGVLHMKHQRFERLGRGCWTSLAPDNSYRFWIFDGSHRNLLMFDTRTQQRTTIGVAGAPGIEGHETYHPRWSNHPRIIAITGPYKIRHGGNNIRGGGTDVEILVGRFSPDFQRLAAWVAVTDNEWANFFPDLWIAPDPAITESISVVADRPISETVVRHWPSTTDTLLYVWEHASAQNEIILPSTGERRIFRPEAQGWARFGEHQTMWADRGHFIDRLAEPLPAEFSLEGVVYDLHGTTRIVRLGEELQLSVVDGEWQFRVGTETLLLGSSPGTGDIHFALRVGPSEIELFLQGQLTGNQPTPAPLPGNITDIKWGNPLESPAASAIRLSHLAVHRGRLSDAIIQAHEQYLHDVRAGRVPAVPEHVRARVVEASAIPTPEDISPYRRALVFNEYEILEGDRNGERLLAAHWAILDNQILPMAKRPVGSEQELSLVLFDDRPELEGERVAMDNEDFLLEWYYDLNL